MALALVYLFKKSDLCFGVGEGVCILTRRRDAHSIRRRNARRAASDSAVKLILLACLFSATVTLIGTAKELPLWHISIFIILLLSFIWPNIVNRPWTWNLCIGGLMVQLLHPALLIPLSAAAIAEALEVITFWKSDLRCYLLINRCTDCAFTWVYCLPTAYEA